MGSENIQLKVHLLIQLSLYFERMSSDDKGTAPGISNIKLHHTSHPINTEMKVNQVFGCPQMKSAQNIIEWWCGLKIAVLAISISYTLDKYEHESVNCCTIYNFYFFILLCIPTQNQQFFYTLDKINEHYFVAIASFFYSIIASYFLYFDITFYTFIPTTAVFFKALDKVKHKPLTSGFITATLRLRSRPLPRKDVPHEDLLDVLLTHQILPEPDCAGDPLLTSPEGRN